MSASEPPDAGPPTSQEEPEGASDPLLGQRILIVEDDPFIAMALEETLTESGMTIAAVARSVPQALRLAQTADYDLALLDVNIGYETIDPVADVVDGRGLPFVFTTGYGRAGLPEAHRDRAIVEKPFYIEEVMRALREELENHGRR